ncbi:MAG: hypothetical protein JRH11_18465 [Deltaproteobacteria bacterium]|nr:hypothetical protein [Deltaproteobacteria bacterium]
MTDEGVLLKRLTIIEGAVADLRRDEEASEPALLVGAAPANGPRGV